MTGAAIAIEPTAIVAPVARLAELESELESENKAHYLRVAAILREIRDDRLYQDNHSTFESYCKERWGFSRVHAHRLITAYAVCEMLPTGNKPTSERQARELVAVPSGQRTEVWEKAQVRALAEGRSVATTEDIKAVVAIVKPHVAHNGGENEWYTPAPFVTAARVTMGAIDLDPASTAEANEAVGAETYFTKALDGLAQEWSGRVWMNPPYSGDLIGKFIDKLVASVKSGQVEQAVVLVNNGTETKWFENLTSVANMICLVNGRVKFWSPTGKESAPLQGQVVAYIGKNHRKFQDAFSGIGSIWGGQL